VEEKHVESDTGEASDTALADKAESLQHIDVLSQGTTNAPPTIPSTHAIVARPPQRSQSAQSLQRQKQLTAALGRQANPPSAERGGGTGISSEQAAKLMEFRLAEEERGRLEEQQLRRGCGADAGPAGMFQRARSAKPEALRKYRQFLRENCKGQAGGSASEVPDFLERVIAMSDFEAGSCFDMQETAHHPMTAKQPQTGDVVEVVSVLGNHNRGYLGQQGRVTGVIDMPMFKGQVKCSVRFSPDQSRSSSETCMRTFDAADLKVICCK